MAVGVLALVVMSCGDSPREVVVGSGAAADSSGASDSPVAVDGEMASGDVAGERWIDPQDVLLRVAGGRWSDVDVDDLPVGAFSAPVEITPLTEAELKACSLLDSLVLQSGPNDAAGTAYGDGSELEFLVIDRGADAVRIGDAFEDYSQRCDTWTSEDGEVIGIKPISIELNSAAFALHGPDGDDEIDVWVSIAHRENVISLLAFVETATTTYPEGDIGEFERVVSLQLDALNAAPIQTIEGRIAAEPDAETRVDDVLDAEDAISAAEAVLEDAAAEAAQVEAEAARIEAEAARAEAEAARDAAD